MDWVKEFYELQNRWLQVYLDEVDEWHRQRASALKRHAELHGQRLDSVLELGAGGGQTAVALADLGCNVTAIELLEESARHAQGLADRHGHSERIQVVRGDFYEYRPSERFDAVCYFDSFGIGTDQDQRRLLSRIAGWLRPQGFALIEVGMPWYWAAVARGISVPLGDYERRYDFDPLENRLLDYWYPIDNPQAAVHQRLRCYAPADMRLLLEGTGLQMTELQPNGAMDYSTMTFNQDVPLIACMTYYAYLTKV